MAETKKKRETKEDFDAALKERLELYDNDEQRANYLIKLCNKHGNLVYKFRSQKSKDGSKEGFGPTPAFRTSIYNLTAEYAFKADKLGQAMTYYSLANNFGGFKQAAEKALELFEKDPSKNFVKSDGDLRETERHGLDFAQKSPADLKETKAILRRVADVYLHIAEKEELKPGSPAGRYFSRAEELYEKIGDVDGLISLAGIYQKIKDKDSERMADDLYVRAEKIALQFDLNPNNSPEYRTGSSSRKPLGEPIISAQSIKALADRAEQLGKLQTGLRLRKLLKTK